MVQIRPKIWNIFTTFLTYIYTYGVQKDASNSRKLKLIWALSPFSEDGDKPLAVHNYHKNSVVAHYIILWIILLTLDSPCFDQQTCYQPFNVRSFPPVGEPVFSNFDRKRSKRIQTVENDAETLVTPRP